MILVSPGGLNSYYLGKTNHLGGANVSDEENLDVDVLTRDLVNMLRVVFKDLETAPSFLVSHFALRAC